MGLLKGILYLLSLPLILAVGLVVMLICLPLMVLFLPVYLVVKMFE